tara:strand:+ start:533 stop:685 length:153 start_codon:yes stop_codon:yes gene_type:complete
MEMTAAQAAVVTLKVHIMVAAAVVPEVWVKPEVLTVQVKVVMAEQEEFQI